MRRAKENVARVEADAQAAREDFTKHLEKSGDPSSFSMLMLKDAVKLMERQAASMRADHERFVARSAQPSPAYPFGITAKSES